MRALALSALAALAVLVALFAGCGDDGPDTDPFPTFQQCFDQHTEREMEPVIDAILSCCLDHPIDGMRPACGDDRPACINYLTANLAQTDASTVEVMDACQAYQDMKNMPRPSE